MSLRSRAGGSLAHDLADALTVDAPSLQIGHLDGASWIRTTVSIAITPARCEPLQDRSLRHAARLAPALALRRQVGLSRARKLPGRASCPPVSVVVRAYHPASGKCEVFGEGCFESVEAARQVPPRRPDREGRAAETTVG